MGAERRESERAARLLHPRPGLRRADARARPLCRGDADRQSLATSRIRALDTLAGADLIACEDTRVTRKLLDRYGIEREGHGLSRAQRHGRRTGGCSTRSPRASRWRSSPTPARRSSPIRARALVADAIAAGHRVVPIPGASSLVAALSAAGLPTDDVLFLGFLPSKSAARGKRLAELARRRRRRWSSSSRRTASRALLADAAAVLGGERQAAVCRELTKIHETFDRGTLAELAARYARRGREGRDRAARRAAGRGRAAGGSRCRRAAPRRAAARWA